MTASNDMPKETDFDVLSCWPAGADFENKMKIFRQSKATATTNAVQQIFRATIVFWVPIDYVQRVACNSDNNFYFLTFDFSLTFPAALRHSGRPSFLPMFTLTGYRVGAWPEPGIFVSAAQRPKEFHMTALALKDVCKVIGVQPYRVQHAYSIGAVPEPKLRISGRRVFQKEDLDNLRKHFSPSPKKAKSVAAETAE